MCEPEPYALREKTGVTPGTHSKRERFDPTVLKVFGRFFMGRRLRRCKSRASVRIRSPSLMAGVPGDCSSIVPLQFRWWESQSFGRA